MITPCVTGNQHEFEPAAHAVVCDGTTNVFIGGSDVKWRTIEQDRRCCVRCPGSGLMRSKTSVFRTLVESPKDAESATNLSNIACRSTSECDTKPISLAYRSTRTHSCRTFVFVLRRDTLKKPSFGACCYVNTIVGVTI